MIGSASARTPVRVVVTGEVILLHESTEADGSWTLGTVRPARKGPDVAFAAEDLPPCLVGSTVRLGGFYEPRPGRPGERQLRVVDLVSTLPSTADAVVRYLVANLRGCRLGEKGGRTIVRRLGTSCLERLESEPSLVRPLFPGATGAAIEHAVRRWAAESKRDTKARELTVNLLAAGVTYAQVRKITGYFHTAEAAEVATLRHPYRLVEVPGIGFGTADSIARLLGAHPQDPRRYEAACRYVLRTALDEGHTGLPLSEIVRRVGGRTVLGADAPAADVVATTVEGLATVGRVERVGEIASDPAARDHEWGVAEAVSRLLAVDRALNARQRAVVARALAASQLKGKQINAVWTALGSGVSVLTGRPGSGKTTTLETVVACCRALDWSAQIVAPTGKAAARAHKVTKLPASTVHRLLGGRDSGAYTIPARLLIVDEASMCDAETAAWLLSFVDPMRTAVVWTGDADQLPSVGAGQVLYDLIASGRVPVIELTEIHRQGAGSRIVGAAHALLDGSPLDLTTAGDWRVTEVGPGEAPERALDHLVAAVRALVVSGANPREDLQVLTPIRRRSLGADAINLLLQAELNPDGAVGPRIGGNAYVRLGDRVVMTRNVYDTEKPIYNGEQAEVIGIDAAGLAVTLRIDHDRPVVELRGKQRLMLRLAWATTVHRSQGSEYPHVVLLYDHRPHRLMLQRAVLYTAITRARRQFHLIGTREAVRRTQSPGANVRRYTGLVHHIHSALGEAD